MIMQNIFFKFQV